MLRNKFSTKRTFFFSETILGVPLFQHLRNLNHLPSTWKKWVASTFDLYWPFILFHKIFMSKNPQKFLIVLACGTFSGFMCLNTYVTFPFLHQAGLLFFRPIGSNLIWEKYILPIIYEGKKHMLKELVYMGHRIGN